ncbi:MAG: protein translocase subunit SecD [Planctomycetes bacterium]|nr:protein translocase subunit SecD [Planctomycetota bacterium]
MQNMLTKLIVIAVILALSILSIQFKDLRLGKDLRGGVSLIYKVAMPDDVIDPQGVLTQTITVLKDRVNPAGVLDISMQPLGRDRIEIVMPLPSKEVQGLAKVYRSALATLLERSEIPANDLDDALARGAVPAEFGGDASSDRGQKAVDLQAAYDAKVAARKEYDDALAGGMSEEEASSSGLVGKVARAEIEYERLYAEMLDLSLGESTIRRTLALPTTQQKLEDDNGNLMLDEEGKVVLGPSQRDNSLGRLADEFSHVSAELDTAVAAFDEYQEERTGFDDPEDLIRLLRGAGVLEFHIAVSSGQAEGIDAEGIAKLREELRENGPEGTTSPTAEWLPINELKQWYDKKADLANLEADPVGYFARARGLVAAVYEGEYYLLLYKTQPKSITHDGDQRWSITQAFVGADNLGRPAVNFNLDASGGGLMGRLTAGHINQPMAIVLDGEIYSAPSIRSTITTSGQITGNYSQDEIAYLIRVLAAGSLQARLSADPIAVNTLGPSIGQDNLTRGKQAFIIALIAVAVFMIFYYLFAGVVAVFALVANGVIIFGVMMGIDGTFTLPGLAGIVLTIGMAVDANVLIYERIREEIFDGELDLRGAVRQGYRKALSTILDANITNLIVCLVLFQTATTEVKGFALTLTIGICATLFTALFVTRQIYYLYTDLIKARKLPMLPTVFPAIHRALEPSIDWIGLRRIFWVISVIAVVGSVALVSSRGVDMFDTEFRGGVSMTMETLATGEAGDDDVIPRVMLRHTGDNSVESRVHGLGEAAATEYDGKPNLEADWAAVAATLEAAEDALEAATGRTAQADELKTLTDTRDAALAAFTPIDEERSRLLALRELMNCSVLTAGEFQVDEDGNVLGSEFQIKVASPKGLDDNATIARVVVESIVEEFGDQLDVTRPLEYDGAQAEDWDGYIFPIKVRELGRNIGRSSATQRIPGFIGGAAIVLRNVEPAVTPEDIEKRIDRMRNQPDFARFSGRKVKAFGLTAADARDRSRGYTELAVVVYDPHRSHRKVDRQVWDEDVADAEWRLTAAALQAPTSLKQISTYSSAVAETLSANAIVAVVLTLLGILVYIWVRFGSLRYSLAAIVALVHDVTIALGLLAATAIIGGTVLGASLLVEPFRIDLGVVAALLTIIGYSLNDTIVILDRIRENRGKLPLPTAAIVNRSINQTVSRTLLTSVTTLIAVGIIYIEGGSGIRPFTFCLLTGLVVGTYSSVAIAAPLVFKGQGDEGDEPHARGRRTATLEETERPQLSGVS